MLKHRQAQSLSKLLGDTMSYTTPPKAGDPVTQTLFEQTDISLSELSRCSGVNVVTISNWRRGFNSARIDLLIAVANAAGFDIVVKRRNEP